MTTIKKIEDLVVWQKARQLCKAVHWILTNEFIQFLSIAKGSCGGTKFQLNPVFDRGYISEEQFQSLSSQCDEIMNSLGGFISYLKSTDIKGTKYKDQVQESLLDYFPKLETPNELPCPVVN